MFIAASILSIATALLQAGATPTPRSESLPIQFVLRNAAMKKHATVVNNELIISEGVNEPYLSSVKLGDFEASGEIAMPPDSRVTLHLYAMVDEDAHAHRRMEIALPPTTDTGWQPMTVSSLDGHVSVEIAGRVIAEREAGEDDYGLFGFEVSTGHLSLRKWRVVRRDTYRDPLPVAAPETVLDIRSAPPNTQIPRLRHEVKPRYTPDAMRHKIEGVVEVEAIVETDGSVGPVHVTKTLDDDLDRQAAKAVKQWIFDPALVDGKPVPCRISIELTFAYSGR